MTNLESLRSLQKRIREAQGADRELDAEIVFRLCAVSCGQNHNNGTTGYIWPEDDPSWSLAIKFPGRDREWFKKTRRGERETLLVEDDGALVLVNSLRVPKLTLDPDGLGPCVALLEAVLPGCKWERDRCGSLRIWHPDNGAGPSIVFAPANDCLTFLYAIVGALIAQEEAKEKAG